MSSFDAFVLWPFAPLLCGCYAAAVAMAICIPISVLRGKRRDRESRALASRWRRKYEQRAEATRVPTASVRIRQTYTKEEPEWSEAYYRAHLAVKDFYHLQDEPTK